MAVAPVFIPTLADLKARLRLSAVASTDAIAILNEAIAASAVAIYDRLGEALVAAIKLSNAGVTTVGERNRVKAELIEASQVRLTLMGLLPVSWKEGTQAGLDEWNKEGFVRDLSGRKLEDLKAELTAQIEGWYEDLTTGLEEVDDDIKISCIGPSETPPAPFDSVRAWPLHPQDGVDE